MAKKIYAIKEGYDSARKTEVKDLIVNTWSECESYVKGVKGAKYKSFTSLEDAKEFLKGGENLHAKGKANYPMDITHVYVDGSFNSEEGKYSYALAVVKDDVIRYIENGSAKDDSQKEIRQIGGELKAAIRALEFCGENDIKELALFHDYIGVCYHATGFWERREESSKKYYSDFNDLTDKYKIKVHFVKVESHTGDLYNEVVDEFAKYSAKIKVNGEVQKYLKNKGILVASDSLKEKFKEIVSEDYLNNIHIAD